MAEAGIVDLLVLQGVWWPQGAAVVAPGDLRTLTLGLPTTIRRLSGLPGAEGGAQVLYIPTWRPRRGR